jgi:hypothetical protein
MTDQRDRTLVERIMSFLGRQQARSQAVLCPLSSEERCPFLTDGHPRRRAQDVRGASPLACRLLFTHPELGS